MTPGDRMPERIDLAGNALLAMTRESMHALRASLFRDLGVNAAGHLQEAGYAGAAGVHEAFGRWLAGRGRPSPDALPAEEFPEELSRFFTATGWGALSLSPLGGGVAAVDSADWAEAEPGAGSEFPTCYFTSGVLADLFGRLSEIPVAVMEVECRSIGASRCRFLGRRSPS